MHAQGSQLDFHFATLRHTLLLPFVGLVAAVALVVSALSYVTGKNAVEAFSEQMLGDVTNRVAMAISQHLATPPLALGTVAPDVARLLPGASGSISDLAPLQPDAIERRLWLATGLFSDVSGYAFYAYADGGFVGVYRSDAGTEVRLKSATATQRIAYRSSGPGIRGDELRREDYVMQDRPWYRAVISRNALAWSPVTVASRGESLTVTLAKPVYDANNRLHGIVGTSLPLQQLDRFVGTLRPSASGVALIVDSNGGLVATSSSERLIDNTSGTAAQLKATNSANALAREAYLAFAKGDAEVLGNKDVMQTRFQSASFGLTDLGIKRYTDPAGLDWIILVAIPRADHTAELRGTVITNVVIGVIAVLVAIALGLWFAQRIAIDINRLSEATRLLASGQSPVLDVKRKDEIGSIAHSMLLLSESLLSDPLTGALNRATFEKQFASRLTNASAAGGIIGALVFVDMNGFKKINDTLGHAVGDALLAVTAQRLRSGLRRADLIGRFGGDEFLLLLSVTEAGEVDAAIERCRDRLAEPARVAGHSVEIEAAFGAALIPSDGTTLGELMAVADQRMYADKPIRAAASRQENEN